MTMISPPTNPPENALITRSVWHKDGSVILQAANTQFRVHWSVLALHSTVFRDMEGLPQPPDEPTIDGCPIVELSDDPKDVEYLLKALYFPAFHCEKKLPLRVVGALIRLGRKYDFQYLLDSAVARVVAHFPTTLEEWDAVRDGETSECIDWGDEESIDGEDEESSGEEDEESNDGEDEEQNFESTFDVITLASNNNILSALPSAYYEAIEGFTESGEQFRAIDGENEPWGWGSLSRRDLRRCLNGYHTLLHKQFQAGYTLGWTCKWDFDQDCADLAQCRTSREAILRDQMNLTLPNFDPLQTADNLLDDDELKFCEACDRHITEYMAAGRKKIWEELPQIFVLPAWSELKNDI